MIEPRAVLANLDLSESEIDVYLAMLGGALAARDIVQATGRSRPTVYYALSMLERRGLLSKTGLEDEQRFRIEPLQRLNTMVDQKQSKLAQTQKDLKEFVGKYQTVPAGDHKPQVSFYEGVAAVRNVIMESIYCHSRHIDSIVPRQNFFWQLGRDFVELYVEKRQELGVTTRNLWATQIEPETIKKFYAKAEIRMMPQGLGDQFRSTIFMYDNNVLYISSLASGYALLVQSDEHSELMSALYGVVWQISAPIR